MRSQGDCFDLLRDQSSADFLNSALTAAAEIKTVDANWRDILSSGTALEFCNTLRRGLKILLPSLDLARVSLEDAVVALLKMTDVPVNFVDLIFLFTKIRTLCLQANSDGDWLQPEYLEDGPLGGTLNPTAL